jgi:hypothetical protein
MIETRDVDPDAVTIAPLEIRPGIVSVASIAWRLRCPWRGRPGIAENDLAHPVNHRDTR